MKVLTVLHYDIPYNDINVNIYSITMVWDGVEYTVDAV